VFTIAPQQRFNQLRHIVHKFHTVFFKDFFSLIISWQSPSDLWLVDCFPDTFLTISTNFQWDLMWSISRPSQQSNVFLREKNLINLTFVTGGGGPTMHENVALINKYTQLQFCF